jgi:hypothetical protein
MLEALKRQTVPHSGVLIALFADWVRSSISRRFCLVFGDTTSEIRFGEFDPVTAEQLRACNSDKECQAKRDE